MASILLDSCVWSGALPVLSDLGHAAIWSGSWDKDPGDIAILAAAHCEQRILVTLDKDFGELAILKGLPHSGIVQLPASEPHKWRLQFITSSPPTNTNSPPERSSPLTPNESESVPRETGETSAPDYSPPTGRRMMRDPDIVC